MFRPDEDSQLQSIVEHEAKIAGLTTLLNAEAQRETQTDVGKGLALLESFEAPINRLNQHVDVICQTLEEEEYSSMLRWVSTIPYPRHHERISENRVPGTGGWLLAHPVYVQWKSSSSSAILLLEGIMGSGKTMLASKVIDSFLSEKQVSSTPFAYFYCARNAFEWERSDPDHILRSLVRQMVFVGDTARSARETLTIEYRRRKAEARVDGFAVPQLRLSDCNKALLDITLVSPAVIVIDAIDEVEETKMHELVNSLNKIAAEASSVVKICITSRHTTHLAARLHDPVTILVNRLDSRLDMELFVRQRVDDAIQTKRLLEGKVPEDLQDCLRDRLVNVASDMYRDSLPCSPTLPR